MTPTTPLGCGMTRFWRPRTRSRPCAFAVSSSCAGVCVSTAAGQPVERYRVIAFPGWRGCRNPWIWLWRWPPGYPPGWLPAAADCRGAWRNPGTDFSDTRLFVFDIFHGPGWKDRFRSVGVMASTGWLIEMLRGEGILPVGYCGIAVDKLLRSGVRFNIRQQSD